MKHLMVHKQWPLTSKVHVLIVFLVNSQDLRDFPDRIQMNIHYWQRKWAEPQNNPNELLFPLHPPARVWRRSRSSLASQVWMIWLTSWKITDIFTRGGINGAASTEGRPAAVQPFFHSAPCVHVGLKLFLGLFLALSAFHLALAFVVIFRF